MQSLFKKRTSVDKNSKKLNNSGSGKLRKILSKISGAFMLPISVMSIAGLFLGIGAAIAGIDKDNSALVTFGEFIKAFGDPVFAALPMLFAAAFVIAFTDEAGVGVFATIIAYLVFIAVQQPFITEVIDEKKVVVDGEEFVKTNIRGYKILFTQAGRNPETLKNLVGSTLGIKSLQTSVFGGIAVGLTVQYLYNRFHTIQLPKVISFFGGKRFVSIVAIPAAATLAMIFLLLWPWIGVGLNKFGQSLSKAPVGVESLVFGFIERSLIPFGLHHVFYAPLWYSNAGGDVNDLLVKWIKEQNDLAQAAGTTFTPLDTLNELIKTVQKEPSKFQGDSTAALSLLKLANTVDWKVGDANHSMPLFKFVELIGMKLGRFADGKFSVMMFGLPAAGLAMVLAAPKENRKVALGTVMPAAATSLITGVTEPIEFTFLFLSPLLFWGFHATMCAFSFMFANLASVHIPMAFSGGLLDMLLYGILPLAKGTNFWWTLVVGLGYFPIYFIVFYFVIKRFDLPTPGRGGNTKLFTKADFIANKGKDKINSSEFGDIDQQALAIVQGFGGLDNITAFNNCASRLRYDVKDTSKVNEQQLKDAGAIAVKFEGTTHAQAIIGPAAEQLNSKIKSQRESIAKWEEKNKGQNVNIVSEPKNETKTEWKDEIQSSNKSVRIQTVAKGQLLPLESLKDGVFSEKLMGDGFAIKFDAEKVGNVYSPVDGKITFVYPSKHAYGIETKEGVKLLVHIGIDTVKLDGKGFKQLVKENQRVKAGDKLAQVDLEFLAKQKLKSDVVVIVLREGTMSEFTPIENKTNAGTISELIGRVK